MESQESHLTQLRSRNEAQRKDFCGSSVNSNSFIKCRDESQGLNTSRVLPSPLLASCDYTGVTFKQLRMQ